MLELNQRQQLILEVINKSQGLASGQIFELIKKENKEKLAKITVIRDLQDLLKNKLIIKEGMGRGVKYYGTIQNGLVSYFDIDKYFKIEVDKRKIKYDKFNFKVYKQLKNLLAKEEINNLDELNGTYIKRRAQLSETAIKKEIERLTIELSWKSSQIEGNTYSLIDTEVLIKENKPAKGKELDETQMILNHKKAIDFIFNNKGYFKKLTLNKIEDLHNMIIDKMGVDKGYRKRIVGITGTNYKPLDNQHQIKEAMEKMVEAVNLLKNPLEKALVINLMISYIQLFEDGNKRTSRILGNAILNSHDYCPLSYRSVDEAEYKKGILAFYEQNSAYYFKELFVEQFEFAVENYFKI